MSAALIALLTRARILPVITIHDVATAPALARALFAGGLSVLEITLRTPQALGAIKAITEQVPDIVVGAGTVLKGDDVDAARAAGAGFVVSPGLTASLLAWNHKIPWLPGVATASDIMTGLEAGHTLFKFFPAETAGGAQALASFSGPFREARFVPTGGVKPQTLKSYRALANVVCVGGSWMIDPGAVTDGRWDDIEAAARAALAL